MPKIMFKSKEHQQFYIDMMRECEVNDTYHQAFFYVMGIAEETRKNINQLFNFGGNQIDFSGLEGQWQTSSTKRACFLAFNLWNGYAGEEHDADCSPNYLFCCEYAPYFIEGIKLRHPEYFKSFKNLNMERTWLGNER